VYFGKRGVTYYLAKDLTKHPTEIYANFISQDIWDLFMAYCTIQEFKV